MGKKGKKGGKKKEGGKKEKGGKKKGGSKLSRDDELLQAVTNAKLWQNKLVLTERQRDDYRSTCQKLAEENETISNSLYQAERDTIEIITILKREDIGKDKRIDDLTNEVEELKKLTDSERAALSEEYDAKQAIYTTQVEEKNFEIGLLQKELRSVKEFRKNKANITEELKTLTEQLENQKLANEENKQKMEQKFFVEKNKMEREASHKIGQYAERAQKEAIAAMDETTRKVFRDNVQMSEVMTHHIERKDELEKQNTKLIELLRRTKQECEINEITVREKILESRRSKDKIHQLEEKLSELEHQLKTEKSDFKEQRALVLSNAVQKGSHDRLEIARLSKTLMIREQEMRKLKLLARKVADERTQMQKFFIDALNQVGREIKEARTEYVKKSKQHYNATMAAAASGRAEPPSVKTFGKSTHFSTNNVTKDLQAAEDWSGVSLSTDIEDLTWEQKEKVIRLLFAKMNGVQKEKSKEKFRKLPPISPKIQSQVRLGSSKSALSELESLHQKSMDDTDPGSTTFITQNC